MEAGSQEVATSEQWHIVSLVHEQVKYAKKNPKFCDIFCIEQRGISVNAYLGSTRRSKENVAALNQRLPI